MHGFENYGNARKLCLTAKSSVLSYLIFSQWPQYQVKYCLLLLLRKIFTEFCWRNVFLFRKKHFKKECCNDLVRREGGGKQGLLVIISCCSWLLHWCNNRSASKIRYRQRLGTNSRKSPLLNFHICKGRQNEWIIKLDGRFYIWLWLNCHGDIAKLSSCCGSLCRFRVGSGRNDISSKCCIPDTYTWNGIQQGQMWYAWGSG